MQNNIVVTGEQVKVSVYRQGVMTHRRARVVLPEPGRAIGGKRGKVGGWSLASRRRFRETLLTLGPKEGWMVGGFTLTVPGPVMSVEEKRDLWNRFQVAVRESGAGMIWRLELQRRGAVHWHGVVTVPPDWSMIEGPSGVRGALATFRMREIWLTALKRSGQVEVVAGKNKLNRCTRDVLPGAYVHAAQVEFEGAQHAGRLSDPRWMRYLLDHASKRKQEQVAQSMGRHWGVVNRAAWVALKPDAVLLAGDFRAYCRLLRGLQRLSTGHVPASCVFGNRLRARNKRGMRGNAVWFSRPETVKRLAEWAARSG